MADAKGTERFSLAGRVVLITGARGGLGLEMARGMAAAGAIVGINSRDRALAEKAAAAIPNAFPAAFDITDLKGAAQAIDAIVERHGRIDCLVNNAALRDRRPFPDITAGDLQRLLETNLVAAYEVSRLATRHMVERGGGRLLFITSMVGPQSFQGDPAYVASKGGLTALMRALAVELGPKGITANAIAPGFFLTDVNAGFFGDPRVADIKRRIPLQRWGKPDELVGAAIFLA
ncbi:MAG: SDR family NAD(P)-dependent oxidoreductase, partial [Alphaproteobacteria bacterium]|nr:SDR family NAD(P)-dependent oxidoreductase [Alphaproteobacteria bacterium]